MDTIYRAIIAHKFMVFKYRFVALWIVSVKREAYMMIN